MAYKVKRPRHYDIRNRAIPKGCGSKDPLKLTQFFWRNDKGIQKDWLKKTGQEIEYAGLVWCKLPDDVRKALVEDVRRWSSPVPI